MLPWLIQSGVVGALALTGGLLTSVLGARLHWLILKAQQMHVFRFSPCTKATDHISSILPFSLSLLSTFPKNVDRLPCTQYWPSWLYYESYSSRSVCY